MKVLAIIPDTYMGYGHDTLRSIANRQVDKIAVGECVVFVNRSQTAMKILYQGNVVAYYKGPLDIQTIAGVPKLMGAKALSLTGSLLRQLGKEFKGAGDRMRA